MIYETLGRIMSSLEIQFWKIAKWLIKRGYGEKCSTKDTEDFPQYFPPTPSNQYRCGACVAHEMIDWIDNHIKLIKM